MTLKSIKKLLEGFEWPDDLNTHRSYSRLHDDHDGEFTGIITVNFSPEVGDVWVDITNPKPHALRFRDGFGGGRSPRVRNALILLALAIKLDDEEFPISFPKGLKKRSTR